MKLWRETCQKVARLLSQTCLRNLAVRWQPADASGKAINAIAASVPAFIGGAADLAESTRTIIQNGGDFQSADYAACNLRYGLREHAMGSITNGLSLHGGLIPYAASFLIIFGLHASGYSPGSYNEIEINLCFHT